MLKCNKTVIPFIVFLKSSQRLVLITMFLIPMRGRSAVLVAVVLMGQECRTSAFPRC